MKKLVFLVTEASYFFSHRYPVAKAAQKKGYHVIVLTRPQGLEERFAREGFQLCPLMYLTRASLGLFEQARAFLEIWGWYRKLKPDITHHVAMKPILLGTVAAFFAGVPRIVNAVTGLGYLYTSPALKARVLKRIFLGVLKIFSSENVTYIVQNQDDLGIFQKAFSPKNVVLIRGSGVDMQKFSPRSETRGRNSLLQVLLPARLLRDKGIEDAIQAFRILRNKKRPLQLILAGRLDPQNPQAFAESQVRKWVKEGACLWLGDVKDMAGLLKSVDIVLLPSHREGMPLSLLEAAATGLPIVTTDAPGCREAVIPLQTGLLVPPKNPEVLAQALEILEAHDLRESMGKAGRRYVEKNFSQERIAEETLKIYEKGKAARLR